MATEQPLTDDCIRQKPHDFSKYTGTLKSVMRRLKGENEDQTDVGPLSIQYSRGLTNPTGENNCFVNSAIQALWHMDVFRKNFKSVDGHACMGDACIFCALKVLFTQFLYSDKDALPPDALRKALAISFVKEQRFQLRSMDDAAECFENILLQLHYCLTDNMEDSQCNVGHCIPHTKFAMTVLNQSECECGATSEPFLYKEFVRYISSTQLCTEVKNLQNWRHSASFGQVLSNAASEKRDCPSNCGKTAEVKTDLLNCPDVVTIGISWDRDPSHLHISEVIRGIKVSLKVKDIYFRVLEPEAQEGVFELQGLIAYYGKHYCTFFYHSKLKQWLYLEDTTVKPLGPSWGRVVEICIKSRYQPSLLFYCNPNWTAIDTLSVPTETKLLPGYKITCKSPDALKHSGGAADFWPVKKIPEYEGNPESLMEKSWTPVFTNKGVVEIGQAALGLVEEPEVTPPESWNNRRSSLDKENNNRSASLSSQSRTSGGNLNLNADAGPTVQSSVHGDTTSNSDDSSQRATSVYDRREGMSVDRAKTPESKSHVNSYQTSQGQMLSKDLMGGIDAKGWEKLYEKQKDTNRESDEPDSTRPDETGTKLNIRPLDSFDMSIFDVEDKKTIEQSAEKQAKSRVEDQPRKLKSYSSLKGEYEDIGDSFLLHHNNAYVDSYEPINSYVMIPAAARHSVTSSKPQTSTSSRPQSCSSDYLSGSANSPGNLKEFHPQTTRNQQLSHSKSFTQGKFLSPLPQDSLEEKDLPKSQLKYGGDSWEDLSSSLSVASGPGRTENIALGSGKNKLKVTDVRRTMSLGPQAKPPNWNKTTLPPQTVDSNPKVARLWREAKDLIDKSQRAEQAEDYAVAMGHCTNAAFTLKNLLKEDIPEETRDLCDKIYAKTKAKSAELEERLGQEQCFKSYSRSSSSGIEDDYQEKRNHLFLQDAVDAAKGSLANGRGMSPSNQIPVTYWNGNNSSTRGQTVRHIPIIVEGSRGDAGYHHHRNDVKSPPRLKPTKPVKVSSTLPRHVPSSRQFFVTASTLNHR